MSLSHFLEQRSRTFVAILTAVLLAAMFGLDLLTGPELAVSIFYLIPVSLAAWYLGRQAGVLASGAGPALWLAADLLGRGTNSVPAIPYWNALVRLGFFPIVTFALAGLRARP